MIQHMLTQRRTIAIQGDSSAYVLDHVRPVTGPFSYLADPTLRLRLLGDFLHNIRDRVHGPSCTRPFIRIRW